MPGFRRAGVLNLCEECFAVRKKAYFCYSILYNHTMIAQPDEINDFVDELYAFVRASLTEGGEPADYHKGAVRVVE